MTRGTQKVLLPLFKNVLYSTQQSCLEQMKSLWKQSWANCNAQELCPPEHRDVLSQPILKPMLQCCAGSSPFIPHLGHNLKIYATMRCSIIQLYWRTVSQQKVNAGKKKLERNGTAFVLSGPVHFFSHWNKNILNNKNPSLKPSLKAHDLGGNETTYSQSDLHSLA